MPPFTIHQSLALENEQVNVRLLPDQGPGHGLAPTSAWPFRYAGQPVSSAAVATRDHSV